MLLLIISKIINYLTGFSAVIQNGWYSVALIKKYSDFLTFSSKFQEFTVKLSDA